MKKKGMIVATIVMVLVLAVSLTTATYAWFSVTNVTTIDAFNIAVVAGNAVNIGVKSDNTYSANPTADMFLNGDVTYSGTAGQNGGGTWSGDQPGLGATLDHHISWGAQSQAVGITSADTETAVSTENTTTWKSGGKVVAANSPDGATTGVLTGAKWAVANGNDSTSPVTAADYVYLYLGASPTKALKTNQLIIMIDGTDSPGTILGMLSAIHVAYRVNGDINGGEWKDVDVFGEDDPDEDGIQGNHYNTSLSSVTTNLLPEQQASWVASYTTGQTAPTFPGTKSQAVVIPLEALTQGAIDQIEIVIYLAGADSDCRDEAKGTEGQVYIFFHTEDADVQNNG